MYRKILDFEQSWNYESEATTKLLKVLTVSSLDQKTYGEGRTLARLGWHITESIPEMLNRTDLHIKEVSESQQRPDPPRSSKNTRASVPMRSKK